MGVRNAKVEGGGDDSISEYKSFRISFFTTKISYCFAAFSHDTEKADEERSKWVTAFAKTIQLLTQSLFPWFHISCRPIEALAQTHSRLMAGYLVHHENLCHVTVLYCELHAQNERCHTQAQLVLYENESCQTIVNSITIRDSSISCGGFGISCSCFSVDDHEFSAQSLTEKKLWLRAISNIKTKLENHAPIPTREDLNIYRMAIEEQLSSSTFRRQNDVQIDPLLMSWDVFDLDPCKGGAEGSSLVDFVQENLSNFDQEIEDRRVIMLFRQTPEVSIVDFSPNEVGKCQNNLIDYSSSPQLMHYPHGHSQVESV